MNPTTHPGWVVKLDATRYYSSAVIWDGVTDIKKATVFHRKKEALAMRQDLIRCGYKNADFVEL